MLGFKRLFAPIALTAAAAAGPVLAAGCGSSSGSSSSNSSSSSSSSAAGGGSASTGAAGSGGALSADAHSAATGDIPDNQVFLVFKDPKSGWSMKYPEGWTQLGSGSNVTFRDKNNLVRVTIKPGAQPSTGSVASQLQAMKSASPSLAFRPPQSVVVGGSKAVKVVYSTESAPNPVTGKRVLLLVDRYELASGGKVAIVDLGTPKGVDNVDAYRMMINSFKWR
jgi:hypothetical protein